MHSPLVQWANALWTYDDLLHNLTLLRDQVAARLRDREAAAAAAAAAADWARTTTDALASGLLEDDLDLFGPQSDEDEQVCVRARALCVRTCTCLRVRLRL
jgi:hypothetical protein